ncbi:hypothetical protein SLITO_v1c07080 [Spiroplasma litorale]|uniref:Uncharacterized protein n=1 Tax=Spiroplasma litorale TaxID=216942 RepID=A0A0K1W2D9_9MOLU|nr:hypothetical protein [Spiroplasma litorale]AKX34333.1 hypothetical protein SLITO_v1c07080 [Spiroplasma litorale]
MNTIGKELSPKSNKEEDAKTAATEEITKLSPGAKLNADYTFSGFKEATPESAGSIMVNSVSTSKLLKNNATFTLKYVETRTTDLANSEIEKNLGTINGAVSSITLDLIIKVFNEKNNKYKITSDDIEFVNQPTATEAKIKAKSTSKNYYGQTTLAFKYFLNYIQFEGQSDNNTSYDEQTKTMVVSYEKEKEISFKTNAAGAYTNSENLVKPTNVNSNNFILNFLGNAGASYYTTKVESIKANVETKVKIVYGTYEVELTIKITEFIA